MKVKSAKTILFASLIAAMILPFSSTNMAYAQEEDVNPRIVKLEQKISDKEALLEQKKDELEAETSPKKIDRLAQRINNLEDKIDALYQRLADVSKDEKTISANKLIKRIGEKWQSHYSSQEEFEKAQSEIEAYVSADLPKNGWNKKMVKEQIKQHNFDSIIGKKGIGHDLVSLFVAKQKIDGEYGTTAPVAKYHEWASATYPAPDTKREINERILEIVGDAELRTFAKKMAKSLNVMAQHGNVPSELHDADPYYWMAVTNASWCNYQSGCDSDALYANLNMPEASPEQLKDIIEFEQNNGLDPQTNEPVECTIFLPCADASKPKYKRIDMQHSVTAKVKAYKCESGTCTFTDGSSGIGNVDFSISSEGKHVFKHKKLHVYIISTSNDPNALNKVSGIATIGFTDKNVPEKIGLGKALHDGDIMFNISCGGRDQICGTYSLNVTTDATKWVLVR